MKTRVSLKYFFNDCRLLNDNLQQPVNSPTTMEIFLCYTRRKLNNRSSTVEFLDSSSPFVAALFKKDVFPGIEAMGKIESKQLIA